jgi:hypothetical protein
LCFNCSGEIEEPQLFAATQAVEAKTTGGQHYNKKHNCHNQHQHNQQHINEADGEWVMPSSNSFGKQGHSGQDKLNVVGKFAARYGIYPNQSGSRFRYDVMRRGC